MADDSLAGTVWVGRRVRAIDWEDRTAGTLAFTPDVRLPGLLEAAVLRSPHSFARIVRIDTSAAQAMPGVHAVVTAQHLAPGTRYIHEGAADRAPLAEDRVRFIGQEVAAVAAETIEQAQAALARIVVEYEVQAAPLDVAAARATGASELHARGTGEANVSKIIARDWGETDAGIAAATVVVGGSYLFPRQQHACMETNGSVAHWVEAEGTLHYWTSTQAPYFVVMEVAKALGLERSQVVCHEVGVGGGFGSKSKICEHEVISGLLSRRSGRPVRLVNAREEEFESTKTRHAFAMDMQLHATADGRLQAVTASFDVDNGAYNHSGASVLSAAIKGVGTLYRPRGVRVTGRLIDTATVPGASFRGYGTTQASFALENLMDVLAERLGMDPLELRRVNANQPGEPTLVGARLGSARLVECLDAASEAIGWSREKAQRRPGRGVGLAAGVHVSGSYVGPGANRSDAGVDIGANGRVRVRFGGADAGTGQRTLLAQVVAQELGIGLDRVDVWTMDSAATPFDMGAWSSRGTHYGGHAARMAARAAVDRLTALAVQHLGSGARLENGRATSESQSLTFSELAQRDPDFRDGWLAIETSYVETAVDLPDPQTGQGNISPSYNFACHAAVVEVDKRTGRVDLVDYVAAHDVGTAINRIGIEGQAIGGAVMGIGAALGEEVVFEQGKLVNPSFMHYALPRAGDTPRVRPIIVEGGDPIGPYGAKAIGECGINPPPSAIVNALYDAIGVRFQSLPVTPDKVIAALAAQEGRTRKTRLWARPSRWWIEVVRCAYPLGLLAVLHRRTRSFPSRMPSDSLRAVERPRDLAGLSGTLGGGAMLLGGGTDLHVQRRQGLVAPERLVATGRVEEMRSTGSLADGALRIGGAVTLADLARAMRDKVPVLADAIQTIASAQVREMATVAGNLLQAKRCWFYRSGFGCYKRLGGTAPCYAIEGDHRFHHAAIDGHRCQATTPSDLATVLTALDARVLLRSPHGERTVRVADLYTGPGETQLAANEALVQVELPAAAAQSQARFEKLRLWEGDFALASVVLARHPGIGTRLVFGGIAPTPWRARKTERLLDAGKLADSAALRIAVDRELDAHAHPLKRNGWKLDAAAGLAQHAFEALQPAGATP
jgi:CO/xanthine dehydrogenase Mo-binding subunit/CO/xanthine dehydrogenase FAD-binding subunit